MARKNAKKQFRPLLWIALAASVAAVVILVVLRWGGPAEDTPSKPTGGNTVKVEVTDSDELNLGQGLKITKIGKYAGIFLEDGSNDPVSNIMMVILENKSGKDLQLARFSVKYSDFTAEFEVSNLPAGESVVALERNRHQIVEEKPLSTDLAAAAFFPDSMSLRDDRFRVTGDDGRITLENISQQDISGDIYVYYKNSATDLLYGGITFAPCVRDPGGGEGGAVYCALRHGKIHAGPAVV